MNEERGKKSFHHSHSGHPSPTVPATAMHRERASRDPSGLDRFGLVCRFCFVFVLDHPIFGGLGTKF